MGNYRISIDEARAGPLSERRFSHHGGRPPPLPPHGATPRFSIFPRWGEAPHDAVPARPGPAGNVARLYTAIPPADSRVEQTIMPPSASISPVTGLFS
jgi:hypothetical protein